MFYPFPKFEEWFILSLEKMKFLCKYVLILLPKLVESCLAHWALAAVLFWRKSEVCKQGVGEKKERKEATGDVIIVSKWKSNKYPLCAINLHKHSWFFK